MLTGSLSCPYAYRAGRASRGANMSLRAPWRFISGPPLLTAYHSPPPPGGALRNFTVCAQLDLGIAVHNAQKSEGYHFLEGISSVFDGYRWSRHP